VVIGGVAGGAVGSGCGVAAAVGDFLGVVPRFLVCARDVVESVRKRINESGPRARFIQKLAIFERIIEELLVRAQIEQKALPLLKAAPVEWSTRDETNNQW
jgi:hypothetical protein